MKSIILFIIFFSFIVHPSSNSETVFTIQDGLRFGYDQLPPFAFGGGPMILSMSG